MQDIPSPVKPGGHEHSKLPGVFMQSALGSQLLPVPCPRHSLSSNMKNQLSIKINFKTDNFKLKWI